MVQTFLGQISSFGFNFAPRGWLQCAGQLLPISQYQALYSLLGTTYGGDGRHNFAIPDLRGRTSLHFGQSPGLSNYTIGQKGGEENVTLKVGEIPRHRHTVMGSNEEPGSNAPGNGVPATTQTPIYHATPNTAMNTNMIGQTGNNEGHNNMQPFLVIIWCMAIEGPFPPRN